MIELQMSETGPDLLRELDLFFCITPYSLANCERLFP
jgi:hypothetical protein